MKDISLIRDKLKDINALIDPYQLAYVSPTNDCVPIERNAHYMDKNVFDRLTANVAADGFLSQLPFGMRRERDGKYVILSGNRRLKAAIQANLQYILILYIEETDKDTQLAYQLSHNALVGKDDVKLLKEIYEQIDSVEKKEFSGINGIRFIDDNTVKATPINDVNVELTEMKLLFLESRANEIKDILQTLEKAKIDENSSIVIGNFEAFLSVVQEVKRQYGIVALNVAFSKMIDICSDYLKKQEA